MKTKWHSRLQSLMITRSVITQTAYGHLNLFDSIKRKKKKKEGKLKKKGQNEISFPWSYIVFITLNEGLFLQTRLFPRLSITISKSSALCTLTDLLFSCRLNRNPFNLKCGVIPNHLNRQSQPHASVVRRWKSITMNITTETLPGLHSFHAHLPFILNQNEHCLFIAGD